MIYKNTVWIIYNPNTFLVIFLLLDYTYYTAVWYLYSIMLFV